MVKVDGVDRAINRNDPVAPGMHQVMVSVPGPQGMSSPGRDTLSIEAKPCTRYRLAARRSSRTATDWSAFVAEVEPIGECQKKFSTG